MEKNLHCWKDFLFSLRTVSMDQMKSKLHKAWKEDEKSSETERLQNEKVPCILLWHNHLLSSIHLSLQRVSLKMHVCTHIHLQSASFCFNKNGFLGPLPLEWQWNERKLKQKTRVKGNLSIWKQWKLWEAIKGLAVPPLLRQCIGHSISLICDLFTFLLQ